MTSIFPPFILTVLLILLARQIIKYVPFFKNLVEVKMKTSSIHLPIEGLRGFLALSVFFCHSMVSYFFFKTGGWDVPPSAFYSFLGALGVLLFFFITGYLFWTRCLDPNKKLRIWSFLGSRFKRIMPAYLISLSVLLFLVGVITHFTLKVSLLQLIAQIFQWLTLGVPFAKYPAINGYPNTGIIDAGVYWTLRFEILFYLALPLLAFFAKGLRLVPLLIGFAAIFFWSSYYYHPLVPNTWFSVLVDFSKYMTLGFSFGMISAYLKKKILYPYPFLLGSIGSIIGIAALLLQFVFIQDVHLDHYRYRESVLLFIPFLLIVFGNNFFGLLESKEAIFLGSISYSFYLFHGIFLFIFFRLMNRIYPIEAMTPWCLWSIIGMVGIMTLCVSAGSYRYVEHKWMRHEKKIN